MKEFKQQFNIGDNVNIPFGTKVTVLLGDLFEGVIVGKSTTDITQQHMVKCTDGKYPNEYYEYDTISIPLSLIMINDEQTEIESFNQENWNNMINSGLKEKCKTCSDDGWVYHSKSGQGGITKDCPDCKNA